MRKTCFLYRDTADLLQSIAVIQFVLVIVAAMQGFGESFALVAPGNIDTVASVGLPLLPREESTDLDQLLRASDVFLLLALFVAKTSVIWLCRRLFAVGQHERHLLCEIMIGVSAVWCVGALIGANAGCTATEATRAHGQTCSGLVSLTSPLNSICLTQVAGYSLDRHWHHRRSH